MSAEAPEFVDTNVIVYAYDRTAGRKHTLARDLLTRLWSHRLGALSVQVLQEFVVTATRKIREPLSVLEARSVIAQLSAWQVHAPQAADIVRALDLQETCQVSFWDAMMLHSAKALGSAKVWSEDLNHGQTYAGVTVENPFA